MAKNMKHDTEATRVVLIGPASWPGQWLVAWECRCAGDPEGSAERLHYIFGPFATRDAAEEHARALPTARKMYIFPLWPVEQDPERR